MYLIRSAGHFDARVYHPYRSVEELAILQPKAVADELHTVGRRLYHTLCVQCHQPRGQGNPATFTPPLAGSEWVLAPDPGRLIRILYKGLYGPITVNGQSYGQAAMFAVGDQLPGNDDAKAKQIAGVLTYIRSAWGNQAAPVSVDQVNAAHAQFKDRTTPWTEAELQAIPETDPE
ncbi:MAG: cytochrome c [Verrucomicrobia bacterium]|nr:cytochrome c [Verrucomicrobiota bacterium]